MLLTFNLLSSIVTLASSLHDIFVALLISVLVKSYSYCTPSNFVPSTLSSFIVLLFLCIAIWKFLLFCAAYIVTLPRYDLF